MQINTELICSFCFCPRQVRSSCAFKFRSLVYCFIANCAGVFSLFSVEREEKERIEREEKEKKEKEMKERQAKLDEIARKQREKEKEIEEREKRKEEELRAKQQKEREDRARGGRDTGKLVIEKYGGWTFNHNALQT